MKFTNRTYNYLKSLIQIPMPAVACLYYILSERFPEVFPDGINVLFVCTALIFFFGTLLGISGLYYKGDGTLQIDTSDEEKDIYRLVYNEDPETLKDRELVVFTVEHTKLE